MSLTFLTTDHAKEKASKPENLLSHRISFRITETYFKKLEKLHQESHQSAVEVARKTLSNKRINCFYRDMSLNTPMEEMALIRKDIKAIGFKNNPQTHHFHMSGSESERTFYALKTAEL